MLEEFQERLSKLKSDLCFMRVCDSCIYVQTRKISSLEALTYLSPTLNIIFTIFTILMQFFSARKCNLYYIFYSKIAKAFESLAGNVNTSITKAETKIVVTFNGKLSVKFSGFYFFFF